MYTAPVDADEATGDSLSLYHVTCVPKLFVQPLDPNSQESHLIFRSWLRPTKSDGNRESMGTFVREQAVIVAACHGIPLALAMTAGFLSKFQGTWEALAGAIEDSPSGEETIERIMRILQSRGGSRFLSQLRAIATLRHGVWVSLFTLADLHHWHILNGDAITKLNSSICDFQWITQRLQRDGLIGVVTESSLAVSAKEGRWNNTEAESLQLILTAILGTAKLRKYEGL